MTALAILQSLSILIGVTTLGVMLWLHVRFAHMPGGSVNVRAVLGAIDAIRVQMDDMHIEDDAHFVKLRASLVTLIDQVDIYVLRVNTGVGLRA